MRNTFKASLGKLLWGTRDIDFLWPFSSKLMGVPADFEKEVPADGIAMMANLRAIGSYLLPALAKKDQNFFEKTKRWMTFTELRAHVEFLRAEDEYDFVHRQRSHFHYFFRNPSTLPESNF